MLNKTLPALSAKQEQKAPLLNLPSWFHQHRCVQTYEVAPRIILADSLGRNSQDLMAAWVLSDIQKHKDKILVMDDQRSPDFAEEITFKAVRNFRPDFVVGHFSSPVALRISKLYAKAGIPFFAPGSSADELALDSENPVFQLIGKDLEQIEIIEQALRGKADIIAFGEENNAGWHLRNQLKARLQDKIEIAKSKIDLSLDYLNQFSYLVIFGSEEFTSDLLLKITDARKLKAIYLSDDSKQSARIDALAAAMPCPIYVPCLMDQVDTDNGRIKKHRSLINRAENLLGRRVGPYFTTSYLALSLAADAFQYGLRTPKEFRRFFENQTYDTTFGDLRIKDTGSFEGFRWELVVVQEKETSTVVLPKMARPDLGRLGRKRALNDPA